MRVPEPKLELELKLESRPKSEPEPKTKPEPKRAPEPRAQVRACIKAQARAEVWKRPHDPPQSYWSRMPTETPL